jgi:acetyl-CoA carboxylase carboxyl transferase subunit beta
MDPFDWKKWRKTGTRKRAMPELWMKCSNCDATVTKKLVAERLQICPECNTHFPISGRERIEQLLDPGSFSECFREIAPTDPLDFGAKGSYYAVKLKHVQAQTGERDAAIVGTGTIEGIPLAFGVTDPTFMVGSMGSVVGEKLALLTELAHDQALPLVIVSGSGGGARMQEGVLSLFQMAKTSAAIGRYRQQGGFYLAVLTDATMGGTMASFASLGDVIIAEPGAQLGFTGKRVIRQTIRKELPKGFQTSEFMKEHGFLDLIAERPQLRATIARLLDYCGAVPRLPKR